MNRSRSRMFRAFRVRTKLVIRKWDRETPEWMRWLTPWGTSLILHVAVVAALSVVIYVSRVDSQEMEWDVSLVAAPSQDDLTLLKLSEKIEEPFATLTTDPSPSIPTDSKTSNDSLFPTPLRSFESDNGMAVNPFRAKRTDPNGDTGSGFTRFEASEPFSGRSEEARAKYALREGGTKESEQAVELGLDWLARHQRKDGSWGMDHVPQCHEPGCPRDGRMNCDVAATGLALLPMLASGQVLKGGRYRLNVERGLTALMTFQKPNGELSTPGDSGSLMYSHSIATMALCEALGMSGDKSLRPAATMAIQFIVDAQDQKGGGWRYQPRQTGDTSVFGWAMMALRSGQLARIPIPKQVFLRATYYLETVSTDKGGSQYSYQPRQGSSVVMCAEALLIRQYLGWPRHREQLIVGSQHVADDLMTSNRRDIYYWYYATQLLHNMQNDAWKKWNPMVRDGLVSIQTREKGCDRGSWDPMKPHADARGFGAGRHFTTTVSLLTLEVYYRYLPLYRVRNGPISD